MSYLDRGWIFKSAGGASATPLEKAMQTTLKERMNPRLDWLWWIAPGLRWVLFALDGAATLFLATVGRVEVLYGNVLESVIANEYGFRLILPFIGAVLPLLIWYATLATFAKNVAQLHGITREDLRGFLASKRIGFRAAAVLLAAQLAVPILQNVGK